jgi:hypothetical protein
VAESLVRGRPCICRFAGALGEVASGGGCVDADAAGSPEIAAAMERLLGSPGEAAALAAAARARRFRTWSDYSGDLLAWMGGLRRGA